VHKKSSVRFFLQTTPSFLCAPQREMYDDDSSHEAASLRYAKEWRTLYECVGCDNRDCPDHGKDERLLSL
jgi:hypothetical protein